MHRVWRIFLFQPETMRGACMQFIIFVCRAKVMSCGIKDFAFFGVLILNFKYGFTLIIKIKTVFPCFAQFIALGIDHVTVPVDKINLVALGIFYDIIFADIPEQRTAVIMDFTFFINMNFAGRNTLRFCLRKCRYAIP
jgi:hypothetical protein